MRMSNKSKPNLGNETPMNNCKRTAPKSNNLPGNAFDPAENDVQTLGFWSFYNQDLNVSGLFEPFFADDDWSPLRNSPGIRFRRDRDRNGFLIENSPKTHLRLSLEAGQNAISFLKEIGDVELDGARENVKPPSASTPTRTTLAASSLRSFPVAENGYRTPLRVLARCASTACSSPSNDVFLTPKARIEPGRAEGLGVPIDYKNFNSDSPIFINAPLKASTPLSATRKRNSQLRSDRIILNNSMDDSDFDNLLIMHATAATAQPVSSSLGKTDNAAVLTAAIAGNSKCGEGQKRAALDNSMDDTEMNLFLATACTQQKNTATGPLSADPDVITIDDDESQAAAKNNDGSAKDNATTSGALTPRLRRYASHNAGAAPQQAPRSSRTPTPSGSTPRMRRHRSLIDDLLAVATTTTSTTTTTTTTTASFSRCDDAAAKGVETNNLLRRHLPQARECDASRKKPLPPLSSLVHALPQSTGATRKTNAIVVPPLSTMNAGVTRRTPATTLTDPNDSFYDDSDVEFLLS